MQRDHSERRCRCVSTVKSLLTKTTCRLPLSAAALANFCSTVRNSGFSASMSCALSTTSVMGRPCLVLQIMVVMRQSERAAK